MNIQENIAHARRSMVDADSRVHDATVAVRQIHARCDRLTDADEKQLTLLIQLSERLDKAFETMDALRLTLP